MIELLTNENREELREFLKNHWRENHIFVEDPEYFAYEVDNFTMYRNEQGKIVACLGYMVYNDKQDASHFIWKAIEKGTGAVLLDYLLENFRSLSGPGMNPGTLPFYDKRGHVTGRMNHYYRLNTTLSEFMIASIKQLPTFKPLKAKGNVEIVESMEKLLSNMDYNSMEHYPNIFKSKKFFEKRYFNHYYYTYNILATRDRINEEYDAILVYRLVEAEGKTCVRIIDFLGKEERFEDFIAFLDELIKEKGYEYIDIYEIGLGVETLERAGLVERTEDDINIIPNYFEPFEKRNVEVHYMTTIKENVRMFRGDGDQDRPAIARRK
ncbi:TPA: hypothetical protein VCA72_000469 [Streptococcus suis]|nr:hypothetical protein [Streptococcus suis]